MSFVTGLIVGAALGIVALGFLAIGAYDRGFDHAMSAPMRIAIRLRGQVRRPRLHV